MKEGLRIVATYQCNRNCKFCYQASKESPYLDTETLKKCLDYLKFTKNFIPIYVTIQGGEVTIDMERLREIAKLVDYYYPQVFRKSVTSNGDADVSDYESLALYGITHLSFSLHGKNKKLEDKLKYLAKSGFFTIRVNCFAHQNIENLRYVYDFCASNKIQLTFCEDLRNKIVEDVTDKIVRFVVGHSDVEIIRHKFQHIIIDNKRKFRCWIYKHLDSYDYNNYIILPTGKIVDNFDLVIQSKL